MGLGGKLLRAQLGAGLARGPLAAQENEMQLLRQKLAQQFTQANTQQQGDIQRQNEIFRANAGAVTDPNEAQGLGLSPGVARANEARIGAAEAQASLLGTQAHVAEETAGSQISLVKAQTAGAWQQLQVTDTQLEGMKISNKWNDAQYEQFLNAGPLMLQAARLDNELKQLDIDTAPLRSAAQQMNIFLQQAQRGRLGAEEDYYRARAAHQELETAILESAPLSLQLGNQEGIMESARLAQSVASRAQSAMGDFQAAMQAVTNGDDGSASTFLAQLDLPEADRAKVKQALDQYQEALQGGLGTTIQNWITWSQPDDRMFEEHLADILSSEGMEVTAAQAIQRVRDGFLLAQAVNPRVLERSRNFMEMAFPAGGPGGGGGGGPEDLIGMFQGMPPEAQEAFLTQFQQLLGGQQ